MYADTQAIAEAPAPQEPAPPAAAAGPHAEVKAARSGVARRPPPPPVAPPTWYTPWKRGLDVVLAAVGLVLSAPVIALAGLLVKLTSRGPVFYSQTRVGRGGQPFTIYKIRSMYHNCEKTSGAQWS